MYECVSLGLCECIKICRNFLNDREIIMMPQFLCRFVTPNYARTSQEHFAGAVARREGLGERGGGGEGSKGDRIGT